MTAPTTFYLVCNTTRGPLYVKHATFADALAEAKRLAEHHPGEDLVVVRSVATAKRREPVEIVAHAWSPDPELPF